MILTKEAIFAVDDLPTEIVHVEEWGGDIKIKALTLKQRNHAYSLATRNGQLDSSRASALMFCYGVVEPQFSDIDADELLKKSVGVIDRVNGRILALSGLTKETADEIGKNSESAPTDS